MTAIRDLESVKLLTDLRLVVESELGRPHSRGMAWTFQCPFHGETHGYSLAVYHDHFKCFSPKCGAKGDIVEWHMKRRGLTFQQTLELLGIRSAVSGVRRLFAPATAPKLQAMPKTDGPLLVPVSQPPSQAWQADARRAIEQAQAHLESPVGQRARQWLIERGIRRGQWESFSLGYLPGDPKQYHCFGSVKLPSGIVIPWFAEGQLWGIKVRLAAGGAKYIQAAGGNLSGALFGADKVISSLPIAITEGEFDCILLYALVGPLVCPVTLGSASARLSARWLPLLMNAPKVYIITDADDAGEHAAQYFARLVPSAERVALPTGKDITDFWRLSAALEFFIKLFRKETVVHA